MPNRNVVETSREAYYSLDPGTLVGLRRMIFDTLVQIGAGHYEDIAAAAGLEPNQVWKRLSELHNDGMIHRTGEKKILSSNRNGFVWAPGAPTDKTKKRERVMKGKTIVDYSKAILKQPKQNQQNIERLF